MLGWPSLCSYKTRDDFIFFQRTVRRKAVWGAKTASALLLSLFVGLASNAFADGRHAHNGNKARPGQASSRVKSYKLDDVVTRRASDNSSRISSVIVTLVPGAVLPSEFKKFARAGGKLDIISGQVMDLPNNVLRKLAAHPDIFQVHDNRPVQTHNYRTAITVGAPTVWEPMGLTGAGIGIAVIDSGITSWHDDLSELHEQAFPYATSGSKFVDFVERPDAALRRQRPRVARRRQHRGQREITGEKSGIAPGHRWCP
jgi:hypothetical protein